MKKTRAINFKQIFLLITLIFSQLFFSCKTVSSVVQKEPFEKNILYPQEINWELLQEGVEYTSYNIDSLNIKWGDSLRTQIDNGLKKSAFGIVVLSENYIEKGWTRYELEGLFNIEMTQGKTILPIWHNITKQQVMNFSPTLAGRMALSSALMTPDEIAEEFVKLLNK